MAKKPTAKQLAARRKFAKIMKSGGFKKKKKSKTKTRKAKINRAPVKIKRKRNVSKSMAKRKTSKKGSSSKGLMSTVKRFAKPAAIGLGVPAVIGLGASAIGQPGLANNKAVNALGAFVIGGPVAALAAFFLTPGGLGLGGNGGQPGV